MDCLQVREGSMICGAIDIGTNTLLLLIAELKDGNITNILADEHQIARLGEGLDTTGKISDVAILRATRILYDYKMILNEHKVERIRVSATSAMRDATNSNEVKNIFQSILGNEIEIITGNEEARISYLGSIEGENKNGNVLLDIGGGSTEVVIGYDNSIKFSKSLQIGAVRITEQFFPDYNSKSVNLLIGRSKVARILKEELGGVQFDGDITAVAGTPTTIAAIDLELPQYDAHRIHNHKISLDRLEEIIQLFVENTSEDLVRKYGVHPNRADVILGGAIILAEFCKFAEKAELIVSCKGLRYGLILDMEKNN